MHRKKHKMIFCFILSNVSVEKMHRKIIKMIFFFILPNAAATGSSIKEAMLSARYIDGDAVYLWLKAHNHHLPCVIIFFLFIIFHDIYHLSFIMIFVYIDGDAVYLWVKAHKWGKYGPSFIMYHHIFHFYHFSWYLSLSFIVIFIIYHNNFP